MSLKDDRLAALDSQLAKAEITKDENEARLFQVFVPGAIREHNSVKADSREEALEKVRTVLISKIEQAPEKSTGNVVINPRSV